ncbi:MAG: class I SAM-dependent rRNA methyltransferase [Candidatus Eisenbacteria bacterium]|nr:class I SAM-dependent rRNA methyltransferase [Candidatus Eisenbacteria bacterium]
MSSRSESIVTGTGTLPEVRYRLRLKPGRERSLRLHHPWVFTGAVEQVEALEGAAPGDLGDVISAEGAFLGRGTVQPESQILARILSFEDRPIDAALFRERLLRAAALRERVIDPGATDAYRLAHSEGDELPGLIIDRYGDVLSVQTLTAGMMRFRPLWLDLLEELFHPRAIVERGREARREAMEGDEAQDAVLRGVLPEGRLEIRENRHRFVFDLIGGQKTGFYLDQRDSRRAVEQFARDTDLLDLFAYAGGFSVHAGRGGANSVVAVESSAPARELLLENWRLNELAPERLSVQGGDAFQFLRRDERTFDRMVIDPPPLARDRGSLERALRAYKDLHLWAFVRAREGAMIWTYSCSQHVSPDLFQKVVFGAARDAEASVQWLGRLGPGADHPVHLDHPQGEYLKGLWLRVLKPGKVKEKRGA